MIVGRARNATILAPHTAAVSGVWHAQTATSHARVLSVEFKSAMATPPAPQPVQQPAQQAAPILQEGYIQVCQGYLKRRTTILKRWKKQWFGVAPGEFRPLIILNILSMVPPVFVPSVLYLPRYR